MGDIVVFEALNELGLQHLRNAVHCAFENPGRSLFGAIRNRCVSSGRIAVGVGITSCSLSGVLGEANSEGRLRS
jgi:hypothetical protein